MKPKTALTFLAIAWLSLAVSAQTLIPSPKSISRGTGTIEIPGTLTVCISPEAGEETRFSLSELSSELALKGIRVSETGSGKRSFLVMGIIGRDREVDNEMDARNLSLPTEAHDEGYLVGAFAERILVAAHTEAGLFYGIQTLKQLIRTSEDKRGAFVLPELTIVDWPSMRYRGWMDDISRGPIPTVDFLKGCIREMASYKLNYFTLYTEHVFRLGAFGDIAPADGLTATEVKELTEYAAKYHVDMVGNLQSFGHMGKMLANPFYAHLGENADILNPASDATYDFLAKAYAEIVPAYKSPFFNINCDETFGLGEGRSKALAAKIGIDGIYARHINRIDSLLKPYGKRIMMWGDIAVNNPGIISRLPKDLVILSWGYHAAESFDDAILPFKQTGFDFMVAPGVSCWNELWPSLSNAVINIANYTRDGHNLGALGMMNTAWDDNGHNLFNSNGHGLLWGAECSWAPLPVILPAASLPPANTSIPDSGSNPATPVPVDAYVSAVTSNASATSNPAELRAQKLAAFNTAFDKLYLRTDGLTDIFFAIDSLRNYPIPGILNEWAFWSEVTDFNAANTSVEFLQANRALLSATAKLSTRLESVLAAQTNASTTPGTLHPAANAQSGASTFAYNPMADNAAFALQRIAFTAQKNIARVLLYNAKNSRNIGYKPENTANPASPDNTANTDNTANSDTIAVRQLNEAKAAISDLKEQLYDIKLRYITLWQRENRSWWLEKNLNDYNKLFTSLEEAGHRVFMEAAPVSVNQDASSQTNRKAHLSVSRQTDKTDNALQITMGSIFGEGRIVYTLDGTEPNENSQVYKSDAVILSNSALVKARVLTDHAGPVTEKHFTVHKGIGALKELHSVYSTYNPAYAAGGSNGLLDGLTGSGSFSDGRWQGYQGQDLDIELDLKAVTPIQSIAVNFLQHAFAWILLPRDVEIQVSDDGITYHTVRVLTHDRPASGNDPFVHTFRASFEAPLKTRYLRIIAHNPGPLPAGHQAAGYPSYIFADEIVVY